MTFCVVCGQLQGVQEYDNMLWDLYHRIDDGRQTIEALSFTMEEFEDSYDPEFDDHTANFAMERNMHERGICTGCGRPDLTGVHPGRIMSEEDAKDMHEMWAIEAQERRAGC